MTWPRDDAVDALKIGDAHYAHISHCYDLLLVRPRIYDVAKGLPKHAHRRTATGACLQAATKARLRISRNLVLEETP